MLASRFSLKDQLFTEAKVSQMAAEIKTVYSPFSQTEFVAAVVAGFPERELMQRLYWVRAGLRKYLPADYRQAVQILLAAAPSPLDPTLSDDDFGEYIYAAYLDFVATYGTAEADVQFSLAALRELTKRRSGEFAIREFLNQYSELTVKTLTDWAHDANYHVRRLVSEGTRPRLPWAKRLTLDYPRPIPLLDTLHADKTRYVTRSVANHLNDIAKIDPDVVIKTLQRWQKLKKQDPAELAYITRHALRTLVRQGHPDALQLLGYQPPQATVTLQLQTPTVALGESLQFLVSVRSASQQEQPLLIDYLLYSQKANGSLVPKTYKITQHTLPAGSTKQWQKIHPLRAMTTRRLYPGLHQVQLQINGQKFEKYDFYLLH